MQNIGLLDAIGAKITYLGRAQEIVSQNIANADTPGYKPKELTKVNFADLLGNADSAGTVRMASTAPHHLSPAGQTAVDAKSRGQKMTYEVAPAGNAVILEEQLVNAGKIRMDYDLMVNLYSKNMNLLRTALGTNR